MGGMGPAGSTYNDSEAAAFGSPGAEEQQENATASVEMPNYGSFLASHSASQGESTVGTSGINTHPKPMDDIGTGAEYGNGANAQPCGTPNYGSRTAGG